MTTADIIATAALLVSSFALWASARSTQIAKKSYELARQQDQRRNPNIELDIRECFRKSLPDQALRIVVCDVVMANQSDADNGIRNVQLVITHDRDRGIASTLILQHDPSLKAHVSLNAAFDVLQIPMRLEAHSTVSGRALFRIPESSLLGSTIEGYSVQVVDSAKNVSGREVIYVNEKREDQLDLNQDTNLS